MIILLSGTNYSESVFKGESEKSYKNIPKKLFEVEKWP
jgi:hypothetical protein